MADKELVMELEEDISWLEQGCTTEKEICEHIKQAIKTIIQHKETENPWHTGIPTEEGFWLVKYKCVVEGKYNGRLTYRAVKIEKDKIDGFAYESGGIGAEEYWKPIEYQKIDELWKGEE